MSTLYAVMNLNSVENPVAITLPCTHSLIFTTHGILTPGTLGSSTRLTEWLSSFFRIRNFKRTLARHMRNPSEVCSSLVKDRLVVVELLVSSAMYAVSISRGSRNCYRGCYGTFFGKFWRKNARFQAQISMLTRQSVRSTGCFSHLSTPWIRGWIYDYPHDIASEVYCLFIGSSPLYAFRHVTFEGEKLLRRSTVTNK